MRVDGGGGAHFGGRISEQKSIENRYKLNKLPPEQKVNWTILYWTAYLYAKSQLNIMAFEQYYFKQKSIEHGYKVNK